MISSQYVYVDEYDTCLIEIEAGLIQVIPFVYTMMKMMLVWLKVGLMNGVLCTYKLMKIMRV